MIQEFDMFDISEYPSLGKVVLGLLNEWPEHEEYCRARFDDNRPDFLLTTDQVAQLSLLLMGDDAVTYYHDYKWMCAEFLESELYFRREGRYQRNSFQSAYDDIYGNHEYMRRYVHGILISQIIWMPHSRAIDFFRTVFLPKNPAGTRHLEIGPGHGLFLYFASQAPQIESLEAWDVSDSSIQATRQALQKFNVTSPIELKNRDVLGELPSGQAFDSAIISEVLEHLERPDLALESLCSALVPGGRIFINVPINSPAPDHIFLWTDTQEIVSLVEQSGFEIESTQFLPVTGHSLESARKHHLSISCVVIARRRG